MVKLVGALARSTDKVRVVEEGRDRFITDLPGLVGHQEPDNRRRAKKQQGREEPQDAPHVEGAQCDPASRPSLTQKQRGDKEAREHKEDSHARRPTARNRYVDMGEQHQRTAMPRIPSRAGVYANRALALVTATFPPDLWLPSSARNLAHRDGNTWPRLPAQSASPTVTRGRPLASPRHSTRAPDWLWSGSLLGCSPGPTWRW